MKIVGVLAHYDESPLWLAAAVAGAAKLCDHIVAVDGAYAFYPGGRPWTGPEQAQAIVETAQACEIGATVHHPADKFEGNQIEKRTLMFNLAQQVASSDEDWIYVFDADDLVTHVAADTRDRLAAAAEDVAVFTLWWTEDMHATPAREQAAQGFAYPHEAANRYFRGLFRALPNLRVEDAHYHYVAERDGETVHLRGAHDDQLAPFLNLTDMRVQHRHPQRTRARLATSDAYDRLVKIHGLEREPELTPA